MNDDSEALQRNLLELLQDLVAFTTSDDSGVVNPVIEWNDEQHGAQSMNAPDLFIFKDEPSGNADHLRFDAHSSERKNLLKLGEIPAVQDRFYTLLKHRLQTEIQRNPPLFPWETEIHDYETEPAYEIADSAVTAGVSPTQQRVPAQVWLQQLKALNLPLQLPEGLLSQLLERCQEAVQSSLLEGARLVKSVEDLFPDQLQALNHLAGMVMTSPARSGATAAPPGTNYPESYESAVPAQQMVLSLLAAREIMAALTLPISLSQPRLERQWLTDLGALSLQADYGLDATAAKLRLQAALPSGGSITLRGEQVQASAQRSTAGSLSVELLDFQPQQPYMLEVRLDDQEPLVFAIRVTD
ncbi:PatU [Stenomitos frigidus]|uniref:PatU n=1 Tax=Stenomitos frigidus ULC18 TaxID=2107698 RepID=A0A2T1ELM4_9CYAN|nr:PatU [Stenomitos frigidus]PSB33605.1 PatU [Stenomitos frigidus ULC18]